MLEVLMFSYIGSLVLSSLILTWHFLKTRALLQSPRLDTLNANLQKVNLYWLNSQDDFAPLTENSIQQDRDRSLRSVHMLGLISFLGPIGLVMIFVTVLSLHFIAKSRRQIAVFHSDLAQNRSLTTDQVKGLLKELQTIH